MQLEGNSIFGWVETVASRADKLVIVSPFFTLDRPLRALLESIPDLQILVGDEFSTNNPVALKELGERDGTDVRCIYRHGFEKRLHAKVFLALEESGRREALVGSANFTVSGLTRNEEQAVSLDSDCESDRPALGQLERWIDHLGTWASEIDWERAKQEYEAAPNPRFSGDDFDAYRRGEAQNYWVLKTTEGSGGLSRWKDFVRERVISIGWEDIVEIMATEYGVGPGDYDIEALKAAAGAWAADAGHPVDSGHAARMLDCFSRGFSIGDRVILCRGYAASQRANVHLYGLAVVDGDAFDDRGTNWWRLKRPAIFRRERRDIPKDIFVNTLERGSLLQTIHRISKDAYEEFCRRIQRI